MPQVSMQREDDHIVLIGLLGAVSGLLAAKSLPPSGVASLRSCLERGNAVDSDAGVEELIEALGAVATRLQDGMR